MVDEQAVVGVLRQELNDPQIEVLTDGNKIMLDIISTSFEGLNRVKRQQLVYKLLGDRITSGEIHAVTMKTRTPEEATR